MAEIDILLQGLIKDNDHETAVNNLLLIPSIDNYLLSIAFVRKSGVDRIKENLGKVSDKIQIYIGIRNGITSVQSIFSLFKIGIKPYVVDTASNNKIFHPKIYAAYNKECAHIILGSANLTNGGLNQNIEVSSYIKIDRSEVTDEKYLIKLIETIQELSSSYPDHVFKVETPRQAVQLMREGRLEDERLTRMPLTTKKVGSKDRDELRPIPTHSKTNRTPHKGTKKRKVRKSTNTAIFVWESKPLTERSLNIPQGGKTNITGDANLGQGLMVGIDFQHYFRDVVFSELSWNTSSRNPHLERAIIIAEIVIKNLSYGFYELEVTHDPRTNTKSYRQRNVMTKIKWGDARPFIARRDLLGRTLKLYKKDATDFVIIID